MTWERMTLSEITAGGVFSDGDWVESKDQDVAGTVRLTQLADVGIGTFRDRSNRRLREDQAARLNCTFLEPNDILVARMPDPIGRACLVPERVDRWVTVVDVAILRVRRLDLDPRYVMWAINSPEFHQNVTSLQSGTTRKRISRRNLATLGIPVPPLEEQHRIVAILEDHLSRLDAADTLLKSSADRATALVWRTASHAIELAGGQPVELGKLGSVKNGIYVSRPGPEPDGVPILRIGAIRPLALDLSDLRYSKKSETEISAMDGVAAPGDVLFTRYNGNAELVGACALVPDDAPLLTYPDKLIRLRFSEEGVVPEFIAIACSVGAARAEIRRFRKTSAGQVGIAGGSLKSVTVRLPDEQSQRASVRIVRDAQEASARLTAAAEDALRRSAALRRSVLSAAFSGRLTGSSIEMSKVSEMIDA